MPSAAAAYMVNVNLAGFRPDSGDAICWTTQAVVTRRSTAASTALVAAANWTAGQATVGASGAIPGLWADTTYGGIAVWVTPPSTNVWHWVARIETVEIG